MKCHELLELRRHCRRNPKIRPNAALLFAEICDYHMLEKGCVVKDKTLADRLGCTTRAIRAWRRELIQLGYIKEQHEGSYRTLIPTAPKGVKIGETDHNSDRNERSSSRNDGSKNRNGHSKERNGHSKPAGTSVPTQRVIYPPGVERGSAREEKSFSDPVSMIVEMFGGISLDSLQKNEIRHIVTDLGRWHKIVRKLALQGKTSKHAVGWAIESYENPDPTKDPTPSTGIVRGRPNAAAYAEYKPA